MTTRNNFKQFEKTSFYTNFHDCLKYNNNTITVDSINQYTNNLEFLYNTFNVTSTPNDDELDNYIYNFESYLEKDDLIEFKQFILIVFERSIEATYTCNALMQNYNKKSVKVDTNFKIIDNIQTIKDVKQEERDSKKKIKRELAEQEHEHKRQLKKELKNIELKLRKIQTNKDKIDKDLYNNMRVTCYCGITYIRCTKQYHMVSKLHTNRIDMIQYMLLPGVYDKYLNNTVVVDDNSTMHSEDEDLSTISSTNSI